MSRKKILTVKIADLNTKLFVRTSLNQDHALMLADLIENGTQLPPIIITADNVVIDGRHRIEAHELNNLEEIEAEVVTVQDDSELISLAFQANLGGSLPPTRVDTEHTIRMLLDRNVPKKHIGSLLALPTGMARGYVNRVQSKLNRAKLQEAANAVLEGNMTVARAAKEHGVDLVKLKEHMSATKKRNKQGVEMVKRSLTFRYKSLGSKNAAMIRSILDQFDDNEVTEQQVREILDQLANLQKRATRSLREWRKRFEGKLAHSSQAKKKAG